MTPPRSRSRRRAFALPVVLMLGLVSMLFLLAAFERRASQQLLVQRQVTEYRRHHESFGVRAIVRKWLEKAFDELPRIKEKQDNAKRREDDFAYGFVLPSGAQIRVYVRDGQGEALDDITLVPTSLSKDYEAFLGRLPEDKANLRRRVGPPGVSITAAPRDVLAALVADRGDDLADRILTSRQRKPLDREALETVLRLAGIDDEEKSRFFSLISFEPALWRLDIRVTDEQGERLFTMLTDRARLTNKVEVYEWLEYISEPDKGLTDEAEADARPVRRIRR